MSRRTTAALPATDALRRSVASLRGVGDRRLHDFARAGIETVEDLLLRLPFRYEDRSRSVAVARITAGDVVAVTATVVRCDLRTTRRRGFTVFEALLRDDTGTLPVVWFNQRFLRDVIRPGMRLALYGRVETRGLSGLQMSGPQFEVLDDEGDSPHAGRIVPVYERIGTLTPKLQRAIVADAVESLPAALHDPLPAAVRARYGFPSLREALQVAHFPPIDAGVDALNANATPAQRRLIFGEFFAFQLGVALRRAAFEREQKPFSITVDDGMRERARAMLPFALTAGQKQASREIVADMRRGAPMHRLLQGDVGAGKTIVALLAALVAIENGLQVAFMAPTGVLAEQHLRTLRGLLAATPWQVDLLTGSTLAAARREILGRLASGALRLVVGTHALVEDPVAFAALGLVVIDEQHRFGVLQRATLRQKGWCPDVLVMTATPIPRTLALTAYGDLDVSVIRDRPPGRTPIKTTVRPEERRDAVYAFVREQVEAGRQAYVVYPLVDESEKVDVRSATAMEAELGAGLLAGMRLGLVHGRLRADEKDDVMRRFGAGGLDVLISTTVIEVGVDVPNATVMVVEHAERFGLAQLHQLRGRVGRGGHQSYCVMLYQTPLTDEARARLETIAQTDDGFVIAERDLELRGPGDVFGTRQSGMPKLRIGDISRDRAVMESAREAAVAYVRDAPVDDPLIAETRATWAERFGLVGIG